MPSAARLVAGLEERCAAAAEAVARAETPAEELMAQVASLRSLAVLATKVDPEGTHLILKQSAAQVARSVNELQALVQRHITDMQSAKRRALAQ